MDNPHAQVNLPYLAGMIDGDGTVSLSPKNTQRFGKAYRVISPIIRIANTNSTISNYCLAELSKVGVQANYYVNAKTGGKPCHNVILVGQNRCRKVLEGLIPFLVEKKGMAEIMLDFILYRNKSSRDYCDTDWRYWDRMKVARQHGGHIPHVLNWDYLGGLFDAEGSISLAGGNPMKNGQYRAIVPKVSMSNTNKVLVDYYTMAVSELGVNAHRFATKKPSGKTYHASDVNSLSKSKILLEKLKNHIVAKTERAFIALQFINHRLALSQTGVPKQRYSQYEFGLRDKVTAMNG